MKTSPPLLKTFEEAAALAEKEHDDVYVHAFVMRALVGELFLQGVATYAEHKDPRDRPMQTGQAWHRVRHVFRNAPKNYPVLEKLIHCSNPAHDEIAALLHEAVFALSLEYESSADSHSTTPLERDNAPPPSTVSSFNSTAVI